MSEGDDTLGEYSQAAEPAPPRLELDLRTLSSVALARLVEEVKNEDLPSASVYDRTYNRHNR